MRPRHLGSDPPCNGMSGPNCHKGSMSWYSLCGQQGSINCSQLLFNQGGKYLCSFLIGTRNPSVDYLVLSLPLTPPKALLCDMHMYLTGSSRTFPPSCWEVGPVKWSFRSTGRVFLGHPPMVCTDKLGLYRTHLSGH